MLLETKANVNVKAKVSESDSACVLAEFVMKTFLVPRFE